MNILEHLEAAETRRIHLWSSAAQLAIAPAVDAVAAHAQKALTDTLARTADGRATIAAVGRSRSYKAALKKLQDLRARLILLVGDAREAFYRESYATLAGAIPSDMKSRPGGSPTWAGISAVRGAALDGVRLDTWVSAAIADVSRKLRSCLAHAGMRHRRPVDAGDLVDQWSRVSQASILRAIAVAISDSSVFCERSAGRDVVHPARLLPLMAAF